jgi:pimeloyl-ACP methyl ester carboxylesterase
VKSSESFFIDIRGLRYHCRAWGPAEAPQLFLLHGWMDVSASFQFVVDALRSDWRVIAPDWRGFGLSQWAADGSYAYADYLGDLDALLERLQPRSPVSLVGHSMGGNIACLYAGVRPERVAKLGNIEGFGFRTRLSEEAPGYYAELLAQVRQPAPGREYADFAELASRLRRENPRVSPERARFVAEHWGMPTASGGVALRADPGHRRPALAMYRLNEAKAIWRRVAAPVLWIEAAESQNRERHHIGAEDYAERKACFRDLSVAPIADAGHMVHLEQAERLATQLEAFFLRPHP